MSSTRLSLNRCVLAGRAVGDSVTKHVTSRHGETTLTTFSLRTPNDTYVGSVIIEVQACSRAAAVAQHITKGRTVAVDGQLTQHKFLVPTAASRPATHSAQTACNSSTRPSRFGKATYEGQLTDSRSDEHGCRLLEGRFARTIRGAGGLAHVRVTASSR